MHEGNAKDGCPNTQLSTYAKDNFIMLLNALGLLPLKHLNLLVVLTFTC